MEQKFYKISEEELLDLLSCALQLEVLNTDGVDNWTWYMESRGNLMEEWYGEDLDFDEAALIELKKYERVID